MQVKDAHTKLASEFYRSVRDGDGSCLEADEDVNRASRSVVVAMHEEKGGAWLGKINLDKEITEPIHKWDGVETIYNFGSDFVLPAYDETLDRLIRERDESPYLGGKDDFAKVDAIINRVRAIGGIVLVWT